jgi:hypothetical protein
MFHCDKYLGIMTRVTFRRQAEALVTYALLLFYFDQNWNLPDRLCGLVVRDFLGGKKKNSSGSGTGPLSLVSTTEELLDRK